MTKRFLTRPEAAKYLTNCGLPVSKNTLQKMACLGGGPGYRIFGNRAIYQESDLDRWAENRMSLPRQNTSEANAMSEGEHLLMKSWTKAQSNKGPQ